MRRRMSGGKWRGESEWGSEWGGECECEWGECE